MTGGSLELRGIRKAYGEKTALAGVDLTVRPGELLAVLGPSGCGKSTLLKVISGLLRPDSGEIRLGGRPLNGVPSCERGFGFVFQNYALLPHLTVAENLGFGLLMRRVHPAERARRVAELLAMVGLEAHARKLPHQLSGGEQQRVALARALAPNPKVLLLDEPLSALDGQTRYRLRQELAVLHEQVGVTTLLVTHDREEAFELGQRIAVMTAGRLAQVGTAQDLYETPTTEFVARFIGLANVFHGEGRGAAVHVGRWPLSLTEGGGSSGGRRLRLMVRPEDVELLGPPAVLAELAETGGAVPQNLLGCRVVTSLYLGTHLRLTLVTEDGQLFTAHVAHDRAAETGAEYGAELIVHLKRVRTLTADGRRPTP